MKGLFKLKAVSKEIKILPNCFLADEHTRNFRLTVEEFTQQQIYRSIKTQHLCKHLCASCI